MIEAFAASFSRLCMAAHIAPFTARITAFRMKGSSRERLDW